MKKQTHNIYPKASVLWRRSQSGAALVAVLLLTMVLSALGLIAMRNTVHSMHMSGTYRLRKQAVLTSDAGLTFVSSRAGDKPQSYITRMRDSVANNPNSIASVEQGAYALFEQGDYQGSATNQGQVFGSSAVETGLFLDSSVASLTSHESDPAFGGVDFQVIMRDISEGPPPAGSSSNKFCNKKVSWSSSARYGGSNMQTAADDANENFSSWQRPVRAGQAITAMDGWIGPTKCGYDN